MLTELLAQSIDGGALSWVRVITTGGAIGVLLLLLWWLNSGKYRHEREIDDANAAWQLRFDREAEVWEERLDNEKTERNRDALDSAKYIAELKTEIERQIAITERALQVTGSSQQISKQSMSVASAAVSSGGEPRSAT